jgi:hypothetical protein
MTATAAVFAGGAIAGTFAGFVMFFKTVRRIGGKSSSKGGNSHQGGYSKHSFHKVLN